MTINIILKAIKNYLDRLQFASFKLRHHLKYSLTLSNLRASEYRLREIAHSIDKAQKLSTYDPERVKSRIVEINQIVEENPELSEENQAFLDHLNLLTFDNISPIDTEIGLPSIRHFCEKDVEQSLIEECVREASRSPKSCSRESMRMIQFLENKLDAADCFSGMTAFEYGKFEIFAVVVDLRAYDQRSEIFAPYIDGAIFSTAFCDALWRRKVGSCMLNWSSQSKIKENRLRKIANLSNTDLVIMGIVVGYPTHVPRHAPRKHVNKLLTRI